MAVVVKYIVVRNGVEKMTFTSKKEADAYDKMLDIADDLYEFIGTAGLDIKEELLEDLSLFLSQNKDPVMNILKGIKLKGKPEAPAKKDEDKKKSDPPKEKPAPKK
ncbi:MAG: YebG family protein [Proteobacteria bacterium]|nr:YebG family protein [Pseudomonadota bacterium]